MRGKYTYSYHCSSLCCVKHSIVWDLGIIPLLKCHYQEKHRCYCQNFQSSHQWTHSPTEVKKQLPAWHKVLKWALNMHDKICFCELFQYTHTYRQVYIYYKYTWQIRRIINLTTFTRLPIRMSHRNRTNYRVKERSKEENHVQLLPIASISSLISRTLPSSCQSCCICTLCSTNSGEVWE